MVSMMHSLGEIQELRCCGADDMGTDVQIAIDLTDADEIECDI